MIISHHHLRVIDSSELAQRLAAALGDGYTVQKPLGEGGFAVVFLVKDLMLKRDLAVKVLSPDMITSKAVLERFRREAETVAHSRTQTLFRCISLGKTTRYCTSRCNVSTAVPLPIGSRTNNDCRLKTPCA